MGGGQGIQVTQKQSLPSGHRLFLLSCNKAELKLPLHQGSFMLNKSSSVSAWVGKKDSSLRGQGGGMTTPKRGFLPQESDLEETQDMSA